MKLLLDEQISGQVAKRLRQRGHDVVAATDDPDLRGLRDRDLFDFAQSESRAFVTYDREDFERIVRWYAGANRPHHGLILIHSARVPSSDFGRLAGALDRFLSGPRLGESFSVFLQPTE